VQLHDRREPRCLAPLLMALFFVIFALVLVDL
jgi:hypothetical protein